MRRGRPLEPDRLTSFPHPCGDRRYPSLVTGTEIMRAAYGPVGYVFVYRTLETAFEQPGCVLTLTPTMRRILAARIGVRGDKFDRLLAASLEARVFDPRAFEERSVITNRYIEKVSQSTFKRREAARRRWHRDQGAK